MLSFYQQDCKTDSLLWFNWIFLETRHYDFFLPLTRCGCFGYQVQGSPVTPLNSHSGSGFSELSPSQLLQEETDSGATNLIEEIMGKANGI